MVHRLLWCCLIVGVLLTTLPGCGSKDTKTADTNPEDPNKKKQVDTQRRTLPAQ